MYKRQALNYNFEAMLKNDENGKVAEELNAGSNLNIVRTATGVTSDVFAQGKSAGPATMGEIPTYYDKTANLKDCLLYTSQHCMISYRLGH